MEAGDLFTALYLMSCVFLTQLPSQRVSVASQIRSLLHIIQPYNISLPLFSSTDGLEFYRGEILP